MKAFVYKMTFHTGYVEDMVVVASDLRFAQLAITTMFENELHPPVQELLQVLNVLQIVAAY